MAMKVKNLLNNLCIEKNPKFEYSLNKHGQNRNFFVIEDVFILYLQEDYKFSSFQEVNNIINIIELD